MNAKFGSSSSKQNGGKKAQDLEMNILRRKVVLVPFFASWVLLFIIAYRLSSTSNGSTASPGISGEYEHCVIIDNPGNVAYDPQK